MLERVHEHIIDELRQSARTDTIFVITAVAFNLIVLGINSAVAGEGAGGYDSYDDTPYDIVLGLFIAMSILINIICVVALNFGRGTRDKLLNGILAMYRDSDVDKYYDQTLLTNYGKRYLLFTGVILCLAVVGIAVPLVIRFL